MTRNGPEGLLKLKLGKINGKLTCEEGSTDETGVARWTRRLRVDGSQALSAVDRVVN